MTQAMVDRLIATASHVTSIKYYVRLRSDNKLKYTHGAAVIDSAWTIAASLLDAGTLTLSTSAANSLAAFTAAERTAKRCAAATTGNLWQGGGSGGIIPHGAYDGLTIHVPACDVANPFYIGDGTLIGDNNADLEALGGTPIVLNSQADRGESTVSSASNIPLGDYYLIDDASVDSGLGVVHHTHKEMVEVTVAGTTATLSAALRRTFNGANARLVPITSVLRKNVTVILEGSVAYTGVTVTYMFHASLVKGLVYNLNNKNVTGFRSSCFTESCCANTEYYDAANIQQSAAVASGTPKAFHIRGSQDVYIHNCFLTDTNPDDIECGSIAVLIGKNCTLHNASGVDNIRWENGHGQEELDCFVEGPITFSGSGWIDLALLAAGNITWMGGNTGCGFRDVDLRQVDGAYVKVGPNADCYMTNIQAERIGVESATGGAGSPSQGNPKNIVDNAACRFVNSGANDVIAYGGAYPGADLLDISGYYENTNTGSNARVASVYVGNSDAVVRVRAACRASVKGSKSPIEFFGTGAADYDAEAGSELDNRGATSGNQYGVTAAATVTGPLDKQGAIWRSDHATPLYNVSAGMTATGTAVINPA
jgi:hypothetical protein